MYIYNPHWCYGARSKRCNALTSNLIGSYRQEREMKERQEKGDHG